MGVVIPGGGFSEDRASGALVIDGGLRFDSRKSQRLTRTPSSSGNRKTWTWSAWVKTIPGAYSASNHKNLFSVDGGGADATRMHMFIGNASDKLQHDLHASSPRISSSVYRDVSSWYHVVIKFDSTQSTARNQIAWYINGQQIVNWDTESTITQNNDYGINGAYLHAIGSNLAAGPGQFFDGLMSQVYLIDGQKLGPEYFGYTDPLTNVWRPKVLKSGKKTINDGRTWSSNYGGLRTAGTETNVFDSDNTNYAQVQQNSSGGYFSFPDGLSGRLVVLVSTGSANNGTETAAVRISAGGDASTSGIGLSFSQGYNSGPAAMDFGVVAGITSVWISNQALFWGFEIDGVTLRDGITETVGFGTNGFYLPFDGSAPIGQDQSGRGNNWTPVNFGGSNTIEKATGALPILNTDGGGKVARVGVRTDANASSLVLALPLVGIKSDFSNAINSGTSNKAVTANGNAAASSAQSNFYGGSFYFDGNSDWLSLTGLSNLTDCTIECWFYATTLTPPAGSINPRLASSGTGSQYNLVIQTDGAIRIDLTSSYSTSSGSVSAGSWHHIAHVRSGSSNKVYLDGIEVLSFSNSNTIVGSTFVIGREDGGTSWWPGYIQDFRIYTAAKYTSNFIPASTDPDVVPDSPSGVSYSSNVALVPSTDGAVAFDGSGDRLTLNSSDFVFGTSSFTVEAFIYKTNTDAEIFFSQFLNTSGGRDGVALGYQSGAFWILQGDGSTWNLETTVGSFPTNKWVHLAVSRDYSQTKTYYFIDGQLVYTYTSNINLTASNNGDTVIGNAGTTGETYAWTGFISNLHIVKGTALYTSNFTPPSAPISSVANTKLLCCKSNSSATAFDVSPGTITANGNAAASNFNPFTVNINTQRGKQSGYCTLSPLRSSSGGSAPTVSEGNLTVAAGGGGWCNSGATIDVNSGKWYWEVYPRTVGGSGMTIGIASEGYEWNRDTSATGLPWLGSQTGTSWSVYSTGSKYFGASGTSYMSAYTSSDTVGVAFDMDAQTLTYYLNGVSQGVAFSGVNAGGKSIQVGLSVHATGSNKASINFGQKPFKFPPPAGFQPLALANTPRPTIVRPDQYVGIVTYSGDNGSARQINLGFKPDFIWLKCRNSGRSHRVIDTVRGVSYQLFSDSTLGGQTYDAQSYPSSVSSTNNSGFVVTNSGTDQYNTSGETYVAWAWKAGGNSNTYNINDVGYATASAAGLTAGTITPTGASVNTKSGFSIITYTGTGSNLTLSHGLGTAPKFWIYKRRDTTSNWPVNHTIFGSMRYLYLNTTAAQGDNSASYWGNLPTSSVLYIGADSDTNAAGGTYVLYLWAEIPGFSKFGSYSGNASSDGPVIITGFKPKLIIMKATGDIAGDVEQWIIRDSTRSPYNATNANLYANLSNAEDDASGYTGSIDILSNGFKMRGTYGGINGSTTYIYAAWAEAPTFNLYGAQANAR